jgi:hypothetical protein
VHAVGNGRKFTNMGRTLSLLARLPRFDQDRQTHRQDCACADCAAERRRDEEQAKAAAKRALLRKQEGERLKRQEVVAVIDEQVKVADRRLQALRELDEQLRQDQRLNELWRLRREGRSLPEAMAEIDRRYPGPPSSTESE